MINTPSDHILRAAVIGSAEGVIYAAGAINESGVCTCELAVTEGTFGRNFLRHFFSITLKEKAKLLVRTAKTYYLIRHQTKTLSKVRKVYFNDPDIRTKAFNLIPRSVFDDVDMIFWSAMTILSRYSTRLQTMPLG